jgi:asparagine synthetase B (glutamine-hydrolysing)
MFPVRGLSDSGALMSQSFGNLFACFYSCQVRVPFLDKDMLDVTMKLNPDYKLRIKVGVSAHTAICRSVLSHSLLLCSLPLL